EFVLPSTCRIASSDLVVSAGFHQVDETDFNLVGRLRGELLIGRSVFPARYVNVTPAEHVVTTALTPAVFGHLLYKFLFRAESLESLLIREPVVGAALQTHVIRGGEPSEFPREGHIQFKQLRLIVSSLHLIGQKTCFAESISPASPELSEPVCFF